MAEFVLSFLEGIIDREATMMSNNPGVFDVFFAGCHTLDACLDHSFSHATEIGFESLLYDYSPIPLDRCGMLITPAVFEQRNVPVDMRRAWCEEGYYQQDPVQQCASRSVRPFVWSYSSDSRCEFGLYLNDSHCRVSHYLHDIGLTTGAIVPMHLPGGGFATLTGIVAEGGDGSECAIASVLPEFFWLAYAFQAAAQDFLADAAESPEPQVALTTRERECLQFSAGGLTAKRIADRLNRSVATINLHLNSAAHKLGASNRVEAVAKAIKYQLLDL
ncbi:MAG: autoinducer binding domain-containing protein [Acidihalobacter sp.]|uniref:helix-turn-helix transcriptional regulator n=1 Tax=Acidihalobacter sp. TaxID=1872108 RepID=UPI00307E2DD7